MKHPPVMRFLGLPDDASDEALLGLSEQGVHSDHVIRMALQDRLRYLDRHPGGSDEDAIIVRNALLESALRLARGVGKDPSRPVETGSPQPDREQEAALPTSSASLQITDFDHEILSILVGCGGWNATSRGHLVHLAARNGVSPSSFMRIAQGLSQLLQGGGFKDVLPGTEHPSRPAPRSGEHRTDPSTPGNPDEVTHRVPDPSERAVKQAYDPRMDQLVRNDQRLYWSIYLFGLVLLLLAVLAGFMIPWSRLGEEFLGKPSVGSSDPIVASNGPQAPFRAGPAEDSSRSMRQASSVESSSSRLWSSYPAFEPIEPLPKAPAPLEVHEWIGNLDRLSEDFNQARALSDETPVRSFENLLTDCGTSWPLMDKALRNQLARSCREPLIAASDFDVREQLLEVFERASAKPDQLLEPEDLWLGSWVEGLLGTLLSDSDQPRQLRDRIRGLLSSEKRGGRSDLIGFHAVFSSYASRYLDRSFESIVALSEVDPSAAAAMLEYWLAAQAALLDGAVFESSILDCISLILEKGGGVPDSGPTLVLARLISELEYSGGAFDSQLMKMNLQDWFVNPRIRSNDLRILTSLFLTSRHLSWWDESLVLEADATDRQRDQLIARIESAWPDTNLTSRSPGVRIAAVDRNRLQELFDRTRSSVRGDLAHMRRLLVAGQLSAAAEAFWKGNPELGRMYLANVEKFIGNPPISDGVNDTVRGLISDPSSKTNGGYDPRFMIDGSWTTLWENARNLSARKQALRELRQFPPFEDIGETDANALARAALKSPRDTRSLAQAIILEHFADSPNILIGLLNTVNGKRNREMHDFFSQLLVDESLPPSESLLWPSRLRTALLRQSWLRQRSDLHDVENLAARYAALLAQRLELITDGQVAVRLNEPPDELLAHYADFIREAMMESFTSDPITGPLEELDRKRIFHQSRATTSLEMTVVELIAIADLCAYRTAQLRPDLRDQLEQYHANLVFRIDSSMNILEQMVLLEQAVGYYIDLRLQTDEGGRT